jgi:hypothetical protein
VAVEEAKEEVEQNLRGSFLEDLRARADELDPREVVRRAARLGCDLARGAVVLCAELTTDRPRTWWRRSPGSTRARWRSTWRCRARPGACTRCCRHGRRRRAGGHAGRRAAVAARLQRHGTVGLSSFYADPGELGRAIQEAELVLGRAAALRRPDRGGHRHGHLPAAASACSPPTPRRCARSTRTPSRRSSATTTSTRTDLVGTLEAYLDQNCNMNATAAAIYAHRHTVAYRLDRVKELTGSTRCSPRTASGSGSVSRRTASSRRDCTDDAGAAVPRGVAVSGGRAGVDSGGRSGYGRRILGPATDVSIVMLLDTATTSRLR